MQNAARDTLAGTRFIKMAKYKNNPSRQLVEENLHTIHQRIQKACKAAGRSPEEVHLLLATKTVAPASIRYALEADEHLVGENRVQELKDKYDDLLDYHPEFHFIGHLQTNKVNTILKYATCIQSVDRMDLVEKLHRRLEKLNTSLDILVQVNTSREKSKFGIIPELAIPFIIKVSRYKLLRVRGLMTIGNFSRDPERVRPCFRMLNNLSQEAKLLKIPEVEMDILSMGMSHDLETAIEEGSTMIRVGTDIFGERDKPDSYYWNEKTKNS